LPRRFHQQVGLPLAQAVALNHDIAEFRSLAMAVWVLHGSCPAGQFLLRQGGQFPPRCCRTLKGIMGTLERNAAVTLDVVVGARVSASPKVTPGRSRAPHTPPSASKRRYCAFSLELSVSCTSRVPTPFPPWWGWRVERRLPIDGRHTGNPARLAKKFFRLAATGSKLLRP
jgi:hypothetical protein